MMADSKRLPCPRCGDQITVPPCSICSACSFTEADLDAVFAESGAIQTLAAENVRLLTRIRTLESELCDHPRTCREYVGELIRDHYAEVSRLEMENAAILRVQADHQRYAGELIERIREAEASGVDALAPSDFTAAIQSSRRRCEQLMNERDGLTVQVYAMRFMIDTANAEKDRAVKELAYVIHVQTDPQKYVVEILARLRECESERVELETENAGLRASIESMTAGI